MISVHTFEMKIALSKSEQKKLIKKLNIPNKKQNWTEHRYSDKGIQIILYTGKTKKFIYLKYIINPMRIFDGKDYLHLLEPTDETINHMWQVIQDTWDEIGCGIPFERFYLSRLDFTCDIHLENKILLHEYIQLLNKSILLPSAKKLSVEGIYHGKSISANKKQELQQNCCKFEITDCEYIQCYNKLYELENENLPIPPKNTSEDNNILRIELQIHKTKRITELLQSHQMQSKAIDEQFAFFMKNAPIFLLQRVNKLYMPGKYHKKLYLKDFVQNDPNIRNKNRERFRKLVDGYNKNITLGRCLELDRINRNSNKWKKALKYLSSNDMSPVFISSRLNEYDELPDIFELIGNEIER